MGGWHTHLPEGSHREDPLCTLKTKTRGRGEQKALLPCGEKEKMRVIYLSPSYEPTPE